MKVRKGGLNPFGVRIDGTATSVMRKRANEVEFSHAAYREGETESIFPTREMVAPSFETMTAYLDSAYAQSFHGSDVIDTFRSLPIWDKWFEVGSRAETVDPTLIHGMWREYMILNPEDVVSILGGGIRLSQEFRFDIKSVPVTTTGGKATDGTYHRGGYTSVVKLDITGWSNRFDGTIPATLFEIGMWWTHMMPKKVHSTGYRIGEIVNFYGFPMFKTMLLTMGDANAVDALAYYRQRFPDYDALIWVAMAAGVYHRGDMRLSNDLVPVLDVMDDAIALRDSMTLKEVTSRYERGISLSDLNGLREVCPDVDRAIDYYLVGVKSPAEIARYMQNGIDPQLAAQMSVIIPTVEV